MGRSRLNNPFQHDFPAIVVRNASIIWDEVSLSLETGPNASITWDEVTPSGEIGLSNRGFGARLHKRRISGATAYVKHDPNESVQKTGTWDEVSHLVQMYP